VLAFAEFGAKQQSNNLRRQPLSRLSSRLLKAARYLVAMSTASEIAPSQTHPDLVEHLQHRLVRQFQVQMADWLDTCRDLSDWEDRYLAEPESPQRLSEHAAMLDGLERVGRWLMTAAGQLSADAAATAGQIQFALADLRDSRAMWHGDVPPARKQEILRDCFHES
jgi:hypothetical protein